MQIKNALIIHPDFMASFKNLMNIKMPAKQCLEISSCIEDLSAQNLIVARARKAIADKYCLKDENGNPKPDSKGNLCFETDELKTKCFKELQEILDEEIDISLTKKVKIASEEMMTPAMVYLLKDIIEIEDKK